MQTIVQYYRESIHNQILFNYSELTMLYEFVACYWVQQLKENKLMSLFSTKTCWLQNLSKMTQNSPEMDSRIRS